MADARQQQQQAPDRKSCGVDEFGGFTGPVQPRMLFQFPVMRSYCAALWDALARHVGLGLAKATASGGAGAGGGDLAATVARGGDTTDDAAGPPDARGAEQVEFVNLLAAALDVGSVCCVDLLVTHCADFGVAPTQIGADPAKVVAALRNLGAAFSDDAASDAPATDASSSSATAAAAPPTKKHVAKTRLAFPLHHAVQRGDATMARALVANWGCQPTDFNLQAHITPLHVAASRPSPEMLALLVGELRAPVQVRDNRCQSLLHHAARAGSVACVRWLLRATTTVAGTPMAGGNSTATNRQSSLLLSRDRWQRTALHWAIVNGHVDVARCLVVDGEGVPVPTGSSSSSSSSITTPHVEPTAATSADDAAAAVSVASGLADAAASPVEKFDRNARQLLRLATAKTNLPYECPRDLSRRLHGEGSEMHRIVCCSRLN